MNAFAIGLVGGRIAIDIGWRRGWWGTHAVCTTIGTACKRYDPFVTGLELIAIAGRYIHSRIAGLARGQGIAGTIGAAIRARR